ncbi:MAG: hypothetical protein Q8896_00380 [Bacteroidota bacterium]|nr:hypothetical protein [Bacteroidota bacterium]
MLMLFVIIANGDLMAQWMKTDFQGQAGKYSSYYFSSKDCYISPGFYRSSDGGITWDTVIYSQPNLYAGPFIVHGEYILALIADPLLSGEGGWMRSSDRGESWERIHTNFSFGIDIFLSDFGRIYGSCGDGIVYSSDNGDSWTAIHDSIYMISSFVRNGNMLYASSYNAGTGFHDGGGVYRSSDSGQSWSTFENALTGMLHVENLVSVGNDLLVESALGLSISIDSAVTWNEVFPTNDTIADSPVSVESSLFCIAHSGPNFLKNSILYSQDQEKTWNDVTGNLQGKLFSYLGADRDYLFVMTDSGLWRRSLSELGIESQHSVTSLFTDLHVTGNPFGDETELQFSLSTGALLGLEIYDLLGHRLFSSSRLFEVGDHDWYIDGKDLPHGMLYARIWGKQDSRILKLVHW